MKEYSIALINALEECGIAQIPAVGNKVSLLKEGLEDMEHLSYVTKDKDAKFGSKGPGKSFYGYKAHIGMTPESNRPFYIQKLFKSKNVIQSAKRKLLSACRCQHRQQNCFKL